LTPLSDTLKNLFATMKLRTGTEDDNLYNCTIIYHALKEIGLAPTFSAQDLIRSSGRENILMLM